MTHEQISTRTGKDRASISNYLRLLKLPSSVQQQVEGGILSFGHAKALLGLQGTGEMEKAAQRAIQLSLSVRQMENMVQQILNPEKAKAKEERPEVPVDPNVREVDDQLQRALGLKVIVEDKKGRGRVIIEYAKLEDFDALLEKLAGK
jgi:ParB family chromosome partitioning protein